MSWRTRTTACQVRSNHWLSQAKQGKHGWGRQVDKPHSLIAVSLSDSFWTFKGNFSTGHIYEGSKRVLPGDTAEIRHTKTVASVWWWGVIPDRIPEPMEAHISPDSSQKDTPLLPR